MQRRNRPANQVRTGRPEQGIAGFTDPRQRVDARLAVAESLTASGPKTE